MAPLQDMDVPLRRSCKSNGGDGSDNDSRADLRRPEVSLRGYSPLLQLLRRNHWSAKVDSVIRAAGLDPSELEHTEAWVSMKFVHRMRRQIFRQLYGLDEEPGIRHPVWQIWRQAGREAFERRSLGVALSVWRLFGGPGPMYRAVARGWRTIDRVLDAHVVSSGPGTVVISVSPREPEVYSEGYGTCCGRIGCLESIPTLWNLPRAKIKHTRCMHDPDNPSHECVYEVTYTEKQSSPIIPAIFILAILMLVLSRTKEHLLAHVTIHNSMLLNVVLTCLLLAAWRRQGHLNKIERAELDMMRDLIHQNDKRYMDRWRASEQVRRLGLDIQNIATYIPKSLLQRLRERQSPPSLGGTKREVTILLADIQNYSTISEFLDPQQTIQMLNQCFSAWVADVQSHDGTVLEFLGDGMLAIFGAPNDVPNHACKAVSCVKAMTSTMERLNRSWSEDGMDELWKRNKLISKIGFRAGIHTGTVVAGNLGSRTQMKYAVVGDAVNVTARLEQLNKKLGSQIAISGDTQALLPEEMKSRLTPRGHHFVKLRDQAVEVFSYGLIEIPKPLRRRSVAFIPSIGDT